LPAAALELVDVLHRGELIGLVVRLVGGAALRVEVVVLNGAVRVDGEQRGGVLVHAAYHLGHVHVHVVVAEGRLHLRGA